jgi:tetratricopeptide (TPR) repeat protein
MRRATSEIATFAFRYVKNGATAFGKRQGAIGPALTLDDTEIPWDQLLGTTARFARLAIALGVGARPGKRLGEYIQDGRVVIEPAGLSAAQLKKAIDRRVSVREAELRREELVAAGQGHLVRSVECPVCKATVDLSGLEVTRYTFCRFCESIFAGESKHVTDGRVYRTCDQCGMFDRIQEYTEFYFYFLLIAYGYRQRQVYLCDSCAHGLFLKMLAANFLFALGIPAAIWVKLKSLAGREPGFESLADGNRNAKAGRYQDAIPIYKRMLRDHPDHPGILTNQALAQLAAGDEKAAAATLGRAVAACNSYLPALQLLQPVERQA